MTGRAALLTRSQTAASVSSAAGWPGVRLFTSAGTGQLDETARRDRETVRLEMRSLHGVRNETNL
jgi:hypothetical protein